MYILKNMLLQNFNDRAVESFESTIQLIEFLSELENPTESFIDYVERCINSIAAHQDIKVDITIGRYKVTYAIDSLDTDPLVKYFETEYEAQEFLHDQVYARVDYIVQHSPYFIDHAEHDSILESEYALTRLEII